MKKFSLITCFVSALFLFFVTSCKNPLSPTTQNPDTETQEGQNPEAGNPQNPEDNPQPPAPKPVTPTFDYTAENDIPADQAPFDARYCYEDATDLVFSDGAWTIEMSSAIPGLFNEKVIIKATASNNTLTYNSGIFKLDFPCDIEEVSEEELPNSDEDFESAFNEIKEMWLESGLENAEQYTFVNGYLTENKTVVLIIDASTYTKEFFAIDNLQGTIKSNPAKTKYVITITDDEGDSSLSFYIYKDANLNDKETIPEGNGNNNTENTGAGNSGSGNTGTGSSEDNPLAQLYTPENDIPSATPPFDPALCTEANATLTFTNGNWKIVDIAEGSIYNDKTISEVSYNNGEFNCSSVISKVDFPRNGMQEEAINYDSFYSQLKSKYNVRLSHGYVTDDKIVLIVEEDTALFEEVYSVQLNYVSGTSAVFSNPEKTKFMIGYIGNGYPQVIYVYKEAERTVSELLEQKALSFNDCSSDYTVTDNVNPIAMEDGNWTVEKISTHSNNGTDGFELTHLNIIVSDNSISVTSGSITMVSQIQALQSYLEEDVYNTFLAMTDEQKTDFIKQMYNSPSLENVTIEVSGNLVFMTDAISSDYDIKSIYFKAIARTADSIKTNENNTKYVISKVVTELTDEDGESASYDEPVPTTIYVSKK